MSRTEGHRARKRFGQNFLVDQNMIRRIIDASAPQPGQHLVEIGPGLAALTGPLLARAGRLHVVEIDRDLVARLRTRFGEALTVHEGDALRFDFTALGGDLRVVGNLPYNISTPLLFHLAQAASHLRDMTFMLQKEVVDRMVALPGEPEYGRLSVMLQYRFEMAKLFDVPPACFSPVPNVMSSIVRLVPRPADLLAALDEALFGQVVSAAFGQRRKTLRNTLAAFVTAQGLQDLGIDPGARGEVLSVEDFVRVTNACTEAGAKD
jgi:16S rRNA (adenine1518-N6/adenine1519-N6)-dimethyltransferase